MRSPSVLSVATTLMSESEILLDPDIRDTTSDIQKWINESKLSVDDVSFSESKESTSEQDGSDTASVNTLTFDSNRDCAYSDMSIGVICDNFAMESLKSNSMADNLDKNVVASETSSERSYSQGADEKVSPESMCMKVGRCYSTVFGNFLLSGVVQLDKCQIFVYSSKSSDSECY